MDAHQCFRRLTCLMSMLASVAGTISLGQDTTRIAANNSEGQFPTTGKTVYVAVSKANLHSGPSESYYPTQILQQGTALEVFVESDDGWLGVRPPAGSFDWVMASDGYLLPGGRVVEITSDNAVAWIGTQLGTARQYRWQIQLHKAEQLSVLGEMEMTNNDGKSQLWYRIAPPAGEFRWIQQRAVSAEAVVPLPSTGAPKQAPAPGLATAESNAERPRAVISASYNRQLPSNSAPQPIPIHDDVFNQPSAANDYYDDQVAPGELGGIIDGNSVFASEPSGGPPFEDHGRAYETFEYGPVETASVDPFAGWHALDFTDDGVRYNALQRLFGNRHPPAHDPLNHDPFDLSMPVSVPRAAGLPRSEAIVGTAVQHVGRRRNGGWRDPSQLREGLSRLNSAPVSARRTLGETLKNLNRLQSSVDGDETDDGLDREPDDILEEGVGQGPDKTAASLASSTRDAGWSDNRDSADLARSESESNPAASVVPVQWYGIAVAFEAEAEVRTNWDMNQLQVSLSDAVAQPLQTWNLQPLYDRARHYVEHGATAIERGQARLLIERIEEFATLARRSGFMALSPSTQVSSPSSVVSASSLSTQTSSNVPQVTPANFRYASVVTASYDATGWLVPVLAARAGQPSHALTDDSGRILSYVSALPGMNLDRYVNEAVGITGLRGYLPQLQAGHIQAQRVVRLR